MITLDEAIRTIDGFPAPEDESDENYEAPNSITRETAKDMLRQVHEHDFLPSLVMDAGDGGIALYYTNGAEKAELKCDNDGEIYLLMYGCPRPICFELVPDGGVVDIPGAIKKIKAHLKISLDT